MTKVAISTIADPVYREVARHIDASSARKDGFLGGDDPAEGAAGELESFELSVAKLEQGPRRALQELLVPRTTAESQQRVRSLGAVAGAANVGSPWPAPFPLEVPIDAISNEVVRGYARDLAETHRTGSSLPLRYDAQGKPAGLLEALQSAVVARVGHWPEAEAWMLAPAAARERIETYQPALAELGPGAAFDFSPRGMFGRAFSAAQVSRADLANVAARHLTIPGIIYRDRPLDRWDQTLPLRGLPAPVESPRFVANAQRLATAMEQHGLEMLSRSELLAVAQQQLSATEAPGPVPTYYYLYSADGGLVPNAGASVVALPLEARESIARALANRDRLVLGAHEKQLVQSGALTLDEVRELRALRRVGGIFERATPARDDSGGWWGNVLAEKLGLEHQQNCHAETMTHLGLLSALEDAGLLRHFSVVGVTRRAQPMSYHMGVLMQQKRTGSYFVFDAWLEHGGKPAHISALQHWHAGGYDRDVVELPGE